MIRRFFSTQIKEANSVATRRGLDYAQPKSPFVPFSPSELAVKAASPASTTPSRTPFQMMKLPLTHLLAPIVGKGQAKRIARDIEGLFDFPGLPPSIPPSLSVQVLEREAGDNKPFRAKVLVADPAAIVKIEVIKNSLSGQSSMMISSDLSSTTRSNGHLVNLSSKSESLILLPSWVDASSLSASSSANGKEIFVEAKPMIMKVSIPKLTEAVPNSASTIASAASSNVTTPPSEWKDGWSAGQ